MLDSGINVLVVKHPMQQLIAERVIKAFDTISIDIVQHSLRHAVYYWFHYINEVFMYANFFG